MTAQNTLNSAAQPQRAVDFCGQLDTSQFSVTLNTNGQPSGEWLFQHYDRITECKAKLKQDVETAGYVYCGYEVFLNDADNTIEIVATYRLSETKKPGQSIQ